MPSLTDLVCERPSLACLFLQNHALNSIHLERIDTRQEFQEFCDALCRSSCPIRDVKVHVRFDVDTPVTIFSSLAKSAPHLRTLRVYGVRISTPFDISSLAQLQSLETLCCWTIDQEWPAESIEPWLQSLGQSVSCIGFMHCNKRKMWCKGDGNQGYLLSYSSCLLSC